MEEAEAAAGRLRDVEERLQRAEEHKEAAEQLLQTAALQMEAAEESAGLLKQTLYVPA